jgi:hypothetical protein
MEIDVCVYRKKYVKCVSNTKKITAVSIPVTVKSLSHFVNRPVLDKLILMVNIL